MNINGPIVSMGLPVYNGENFVAEAIQCALDQTFANWELVISDNCSTDRTLAICREFAERDSRIRVSQNARNMGFAPNFNEVFRRSHGRYFMWMTHDDLFAPEYIESCLEELAGDERVVLAFPRLSYIDENRRVLRRQTSELSLMGPTAESRVEQLMLLESQGTDIYWCQFGLVRREVLEQTSLMAFYGGSDQTLLLEIALRGCFKQVEKDLFFRREHPGAATIRRGWTARDRAKFVYADNRSRLVFPYCRMLKEHLLCILKSPLSLAAKLWCTTAILKRFLGQWKYFAEEAVWSPIHALRPK